MPVEPGWDLCLSFGQANYQRANNDTAYYPFQNFTLLLEITNAERTFRLVCHIRFSSILKIFLNTNCSFADWQQDLK
jgi:hypothetical protein